MTDQQKLMDLLNDWNIAYQVATLEDGAIAVIMYSSDSPHSSKKHYFCFYPDSGKFSTHYLEAH